MITRFYVFRHGETDWNATGRVQGHTDIALNALGREQAGALAEKLAGVGLEQVVSSDLARAAATGEAVAKRAGVALVLEPRLREIRLGVAEGVLGAETVKLFGEEACRAWKSVEPADRDFQFAGGERKSDAVARFASVLEELSHGPHRIIGISTHGGLMRNAAGKKIPVPNCAVHLFEIERNGPWRYVVPF